MAMHKEFEETDAMKTQARPTLRTPRPTLGSQEGWTPPGKPGGKRTVHKALGRRVRTHAREDY